MCDPLKANLIRGVLPPARRHSQPPHGRHCLGFNQPIGLLDRIQVIVSRMQKVLSTMPAVSLFSQKSNPVFNLYKLIYCLGSAGKLAKRATLCQREKKKKKPRTHIWSFSIFQDKRKWMIDCEGHTTHTAHFFCLLSPTIHSSGTM